MDYVLDESDPSALALPRFALGCRIRFRRQQSDLREYLDVLLEEGGDFGTGRGEWEVA